MLLRREAISDELFGDVQSTARAWLERASDELAVLELILKAEQWRVAYNAAYDIYRHAAEAVDLNQGYRILAKPGAHRSTFALASALLGPQGQIFGESIASAMTGTRNKLEYLSDESDIEVDDADARWAVSVAAEAVEAARKFVG